MRMDDDKILEELDNGSKEERGRERRMKMMVLTAEEIGYRVGYICASTAVLTIVLHQQRF